MLNPTASQWRIVPIGVRAYRENPKHYLLGVIFGPSLSHSTVAHSPVSLLSGKRLTVQMKPWGGQRTLMGDQPPIPCPSCAISYPLALGLAQALLHSQQ